MATRIAWTPQARRWFDGLGTRDAERIAPALDALARDGLSARRTQVKRIKSARDPTMHELRSSGGHLRVLFAMDGHGAAVMLHGGDKTGLWNSWYDQWVKVADARMDQRRRATGKEQTWARTRAGTRSAAREA